MQQTEKSTASGAPRPAGPAWRPWLCGASLVLLVAIVYWPTLDNGFIWDDDYYVEENVTLTSLAGLHDVWFKLGAVPQYYPLVHSTFWVEQHLWGLDPRGYHATNMLLHAAAAVLLWRLLSRLAMPGAWLAAAIFAVHPIQVESVAWITERKNVLSAALALGSLLAYLRFAPPEQAAIGPRGAAAPPRWRCYGLALALYVAALLSKTVTASLPAVLLVIYGWTRGRLTGRDVAPLVPFFAVGLALAGLTVWMEKNHVGASGSEWDFSPVERGLIAGRAAWSYAGKLFWPHPLIFFYPRWTIDVHAWWQYLFPASALALVGGLWLARNQLGRGPLAAALIFGGVLVPALGFFNVFPFRYSFVADHFQYHAGIALIAWAAAAATLAARWLAIPRWMTPLAAAALLVPLVLVARQKTLVYRDSTSLFADTIEANPSCWAAYHNLATQLAKQGNYLAAIEHFQAAVRLSPDDATPRNSLAWALYHLHSYDEAAAELDRAMACVARPVERTRSYTFLGAVQIEQRRFDEALANLDKAIELSPDAGQPHLYRGRIRAIQGDIPAALACVEQALKLEPGVVEAVELHAQLLTVQGKYHRALTELNTLRPMMHDNPQWLVQIAGLHQALKEWRQAVANYDRALALDPKNAAAFRGRGDSHLGFGNQAAAIADYEASLKIEPSVSEVQNNLAWILATSPDAHLRNAPRAIELAEAACAATAHGRPDLLSTLAAAHAEAGDFASAIAWSKKSVELADEPLKAQLREQLKTYQSHQPWREALPPDQHPDSAVPQGKPNQAQARPARDRQFAARVAVRQRKSP